MSIHSIQPIPREQEQRIQDETLSQCVTHALEIYFAELNGHETTDIYSLVLREVERPMLETVLRHAGGNQSKAAQILGISRSTLRKKMALYQLG